MAKRTGGMRDKRESTEQRWVSAQYARRTQNPSLFRMFVPVIIFSGAVLWAAANRGNSVWAVAALALGIGLMLAFLAPRHKVLLGSLPALGTFIILLIPEVSSGWAALQEVADFWVPVSLGAIVGALLGSRIKPRR